MPELYPEPTPQIEVYTVIEVTFRRGSGTPDDYVRMVKAYYKDDGEFLFEIDPFPDKEGAPVEGDAQWEHPRLGVAALREGFEPE